MHFNRIISNDIKFKFKACLIILFSSIAMRVEEQKDSRFLCKLCRYHPQGLILPRQHNVLLIWKLRGLGGGVDAVVIFAVLFF